MDREELEAFRKHLASLEPYRILNVYREAWYGCRPGEVALPNGRAVQELVQAWKALRKRLPRSANQRLQGSTAYRSKMSSSRDLVTSSSPILFPTISRLNCRRQR